MRFRTIDADLRFRKYDIIEIEIRKRDGRDLRIESYQPDQHTLRVVDHVNSDGRQWSRRRALIGSLMGATSTCELIRANPPGQMGFPAPSLGMIKPRVDAVQIDPGPAWTPNQRSKAMAASAPPLFGVEIPMLEPMPFRLTYRYRCADTTCRGHVQQCLDWELGAAGRQLLKQYEPAEAETRLRESWERMMTDPRLDLHFFVGNQALRRRSFEVLGTWYPRSPSETTTDQLPLF
ncbi:hypothetical protein JK358_36380 [Nocardia sp. 2]|uniref:Uncharacterized protein n=1 Tax=Nocardia acididurans TaxID=2802282 RepID=A0ABS1MH29_9NOCA|nr:hypothetical protein [Nocardia acididurans]MBL1079889.1 hypothetical protein [Nocardia acididurans]